MAATLIILTIALPYVMVCHIPIKRIKRMTGILIAFLAMVIFFLAPAGKTRAVQGAEGISHGSGTHERDKPARRLTVTAISRGKSEGGRSYRIVLVCDTSRKRAKGLMGFRPLKPEEAALFVFDRPETATFWMGSVTFPIDIIFVSSEHAVVSVYAGCRPGSRDYYPSTAPVKWVIETAAGSGIGVGDRVNIE